ncbi:MAG: hypothetical protein C4304_10270 [candidate division GAL15 bacterium]
MRGEGQGLQVQPHGPQVLGTWAAREHVALAEHTQARGDLGRNPHGAQLQGLPQKGVGDLREPGQAVVGVEGVGLAVEVEPVLRGQLQAVAGAEAHQVHPRGELQVARLSRQGLRKG